MLGYGAVKRAGIAEKPKAVMTDTSTEHRKASETLNSRLLKRHSYELFPTAYPAS
jgi:hypothetical protein